MKKKPTISIVLPTFNRLECLPQTVHSILQQTYDDLELIIVDDGSTDDTESYLKSIKDGRVHSVVLETNRGIGYSRHEGVNASQGHYIAMADSDDTWFPDKLARQIEIFNKYPEVDFIFSNFYNQNNKNHSSLKEGIALNDWILPITARILEPDIYLLQSEGLVKKLFEKLFIHQASILFKKKLIDTIGNYRKDLSGSEDREFFCRLAFNGCSFAMLNKFMVNRYKDETSISNQIFLHSKDLLKTLQYCEDMVRAKEDRDLLNLINKSKQKSHLKLLREFVFRKDIRNVFKSWIRVNKYGFSLRSFKLIGGLFLPSSILHWFLKSE